MALIVGRWAPLVTCKRVSGEPWVVAERSAAASPRLCSRQSVVGVDRKMMAHALPIADIEAVINGAANGLLVANARKRRQVGSRERRVEGAGAACSSHRNPLINIDGLVLVQTKNVCVFRLDDGIGIERPAIPNVELLGHRVAIVRIHQAAYAA